MTRKLLMPCVVAGVVVLATAGYGSTAPATNPNGEIQREAALYRIDQVERTFHRAVSTHDVDLMVSLFAPGATFNIGTEAYTGKAQIRRFFATKNPAFQPDNHWVSDTPSYKIRETVNGDSGTLYMECDDIDPKTKKVMLTISVNHNLQKIDGKWLIVDAAASITTMSP